MGCAQLDPDQGEPDRYADRNARRYRDGASCRIYVGYFAPFGRNRGFDDRRHRRSDQLRVRSRPARCRVPTVWPSITSCSGSRKSSVTRRFTAILRFTASNPRLMEESPPQDQCLRRGFFCCRLSWSAISKCRFQGRICRMFYSVSSAVSEPDAAGIFSGSIPKADTMIIFSSTLLGLVTMMPYSPAGASPKVR